MITSKKQKQLYEKMRLLGIREEDFIEKYIIGSGRGGQKLQKTASCVYLQHIPTGIEIKCQQTRSRESNRYYARQRLCEKIDELLNREKSEKQREIEKIRHQKRKRSRRAKQKILEDKHHRSALKETRKKSSLLHDDNKPT